MVFFSCREFGANRLLMFSRVDLLGDSLCSFLSRCAPPFPFYFSPLVGPPFLPPCSMMTFSFTATVRKSGFLRSGFVQTGFFFLAFSCCVFLTCLPRQPIKGLVSKKVKSILQRPPPPLPSRVTKRLPQALFLGRQVSFLPKNQIEKRRAEGI